jgi:hypothetical protein
MNPRRLSLIIGSTLLVVLLVGCSASKPTATTAVTSATAETTPGKTQAVRARSGGECANAYFPVASGNSWSYSSSGGELGAYTYTSTVTDVSSTDFTINSQASTGVNANVKWKCQNGNLAELNDGSNSLSLSTSKVTMTTNSITADGYNVPAAFETGATWTETVTADVTVVSGTKSTNSQIVIVTKCTAAGADTVTVPAGKFNAVKVTCNQTVTVFGLIKGTAVPASPPIAVSVTNWYAKGVGLVQSVKTTAAGGTETVVLTKYKLQ